MPNILILQITEQSLFVGLEFYVYDGKNMWKPREWRHEHHQKRQKNNIKIGFAFFEKSLCDDSLENTRNFLVDIVQYHLVKAFNLHNNYSG